MRGLSLSHLSFCYFFKYPQVASLSCSVVNTEHKYTNSMVWGSCRCNAVIKMDALSKHCVPKQFPTVPWTRSMVALDKQLSTNHRVDPKYCGQSKEQFPTSYLLL